MTTETSGADPKETSGKLKRKRISAKELATAKVLREVDGLSWIEIGKRLGYHRDTIVNGLMKAKGITPKRNAKAESMAESTVKKIETELAKDVAERIRKIKETRDETYRYAQTIQKMIMHAHIKCIKDKVPIATVSNDVRTMREAMAALRTGQDMRFIALGIKDGVEAVDEDLVELQISEISDDQAKSLQSSQFDEDLQEIASMQRDTADDSDDDNEVVVEGEGDDGNVSGD